MSAQNHVVRTSEWEVGYISHTLRRLTNARVLRDVFRNPEQLFGNNIGSIYLGEVPNGFVYGHVNIGLVIGYDEQDDNIWAVKFVIDPKNQEVEYVGSENYPREKPFASPKYYVYKAIATKRISEKEMQEFNDACNLLDGCWTDWNQPLHERVIKTIYKNQPLKLETLELARIFFDNISP